MTIDLDQETKRLASQIDELLDQVISAADALRTKIQAKEVDPRSSMRGLLPGNLILDIYPLKASHYLACLYLLDLFLPAIFNNNRILKCVDALLLNYDSHHAKWILEGFSFIDGKEKFRQKLVRYRPEWLKGKPPLTPVMTLNRSGPAAEGNPDIGIISPR